MMWFKMQVYVICTKRIIIGHQLHMKMDLEDKNISEKWKKWRFFSIWPWNDLHLDLVEVNVIYHFEVLYDSSYMHEQIFHYLAYEKSGRQIYLFQVGIILWRPSWTPSWISQNAVTFRNLCRQCDKLQTFTNILIYDSSCWKLWSGYP